MKLLKHQDNLVQIAHRILDIDNVPVVHDFNKFTNKRTSYLRGYSKFKGTIMKNSSYRIDCDGQICPF